MAKRTRDRKSPSKSKSFFSNLRARTRRIKNRAKAAFGLNISTPDQIELDEEDDRQLLKKETKRIENVSKNVERIRITTKLDLETDFLKDCDMTIGERYYIIDIGLGQISTGIYQGFSNPDDGKTIVVFSDIKSINRLPETSPVEFNKSIDLYHRTPGYPETSDLLPLIVPDIKLYSYNIYPNTYLYSISPKKPGRKPLDEILRLRHDLKKVTVLKPGKEYYIDNYNNDLSNRYVMEHGICERVINYGDPNIKFYHNGALFKELKQLYISTKDIGTNNGDLLGNCSGGNCNSSDGIEAFLEENVPCNFRNSSYHTFYEVDKKKLISQLRSKRANLGPDTNKGIDSLIGSFLRG
jgi:hypothetical protein